MCVKKILIIITLLTVTAFAQQVPKWILELDDPIESYNFLRDGNYLFLQCGEHAWLYDAVTGKNIYSLEVDDYEVKGAHQLVGEKYLVSADNNLLCYDAMTGKLIWQKEYNKIDQDEFTELSFAGNITILRYGLEHLGIDLNSGNELWRTRLSYNQWITRKGGWNVLSLDKQQKLLVLLDSDALGLYSYKDGKEVLFVKDFEIDGDMVESKQTWCYVSPNQRYCVFTLDGFVSIIDVQENKEIFRRKTSFDEEKGAIFPTENGCAVLGDEVVVSIDFNSGKVSEVKASIDDFRTFQIMKVGNKEILFAGLKNEMFAIDFADGKILWRSNKGDKNFEGYAHRYIKVDGNNLLVTYTNTSASEGGANIYLMSIDALTGKVNYKTPSLGNTPYGQADWARSIFSPFMKLMKVENTLGYENIGFNYSIEEFEGNLVFGTLSINSLQNPDTKESGGDGIALINPKTGEILFKDYLRLSDYSIMSIGAVRYADMMPYINGNLAFLVGDENIAAYDLKAKKRLWLNKETLKGIPREAMLVDNVLYVKFGERKFNVSLSEPETIFQSISMKIENKWDEDPYGFAAYDCATGNLLWRIETEVDPSFLTPGFSLKNNYDPITKRLYYGDEENIYALQLTPNGGKFDYVINLDKSKIGEMPFEKTYAIQEWPISGRFIGLYSVVSEAITGTHLNKFISASEEADAWIVYDFGFTIWGAAAKKCLRTVYNENSIFAMGTEGIAMINAADGKINWLHKWEYDQDNVQFMPQVIGDKLVYCVDRKVTSVNMKTGTTKWSADEAKRPIFLVSPNNKYIFTIDKEVIKGYEL
ncbi:MAG: PQQ-binding-like beta-propeller repeat protein [Melioribacteraceae bacterium]